MTPTEAMEIWRQFDTDTAGRDFGELERHAAYVLSNAYLAEHDTTPLTLELCIEALGEPRPSSDMYQVWNVGNVRVFVSFDYKSLWFENEEIPTKNPTLGQLRRLVGVLRGES